MSSISKNDLIEYFENIVINYEKKTTTINNEYENLNPFERKIKRLNILAQLARNKNLGYKVSNFSLDDDYYSMKYELEIIQSIKYEKEFNYISNFLNILKSI